MKILRTSSQVLMAVVLIAALSACQQRATTDPQPGEEPAAGAEQASAPAVPEQPFAELTGPHAVGVRDLYLVDEQRGEPFTSDPEDRRRLPIRVWYPATVSDGDTPARYVPDLGEFPGNPTFEGLGHVVTRGFADAQPDRSAESYPVLLFNPGGGWTRLSDTFWTEQLASHGYVVFAVDHSGFNQSVVFPDGSGFEADQHGFPAETGDMLEDARASWRYLDEHHFPLWLADSSAVLDYVEELAAEPGGAFADLMDLSRVGALGWSFGGATAVQLTVSESSRQSRCRW